MLFVHSFINLIDYMQTNMMHVLLHNTYRELVHVLNMHSQFLPSNEALSSSEVDVILEVSRQPGIWPQVFLYHFERLIIISP